MQPSWQQRRACSAQRWCLDCLWRWLLAASGARRHTRALEVLLLLLPLSAPVETCATAAAARYSYAGNLW